MNKEITLTPLAEVGQGRATITDEHVEIQTSGIIGALKAWLIGGEAVPIGNIVEGKLQKSIDTTNHDGILITQSGRQMLIGHYRQGEESLEVIPFENMGFQWHKITEKSFAMANASLRFLLSNKNVYENYKRHRHYFVGDSEEGSAIALRYDEENPLTFLGKTGIVKNGYAVICIDKKTGKLYVPDEKR